LYASPNIIKAIKSRRIRWADHVAHMEEMKNAYKSVGQKTRRDELGVDGRIILE
jgi:hypothetical protein